MFVKEEEAVIWKGDFFVCKCQMMSLLGQFHMEVTDYTLSWEGPGAHGTTMYRL